MRHIEFLAVAPQQTVHRVIHTSHKKQNLTTENCHCSNGPATDDSGYVGIFPDNCELDTQHGPESKEIPVAIQIAGTVSTKVFFDTARIPAIGTPVYWNTAENRLETNDAGHYCGRVVTTVECYKECAHTLVHLIPRNS